MKQLFLSMILGLFALTAQADYFTAAYVHSDLEVDTPFNEVFDDDANGFLVGYGWQTAKPWLSIELTYTDFGDSDKSFYDGELTTAYEGKAVDLWLVGRLSPFSITENRPLNIVPRVGLTAASSQASIEDISFSDTGVGYAYGIGLELANVVPSVDVYVDYRRYQVDMVYGYQAVTFDPATINAGLTWHF